INLRGVERYFGEFRDTRGFSGERKTGGVRISPGETKAGVHQSSPQVGDARVLHAILYVLLGIISHRHHLGASIGPPESNSPCGTKLDGPGWADKLRASKNAVLLYLTGRSNRTNSTESADGTF